MRERPNIVIVMADQLAPQFTSTYGHPIVKTPHLDSLASRGTRFDTAYCNAPRRRIFFALRLVSVSCLANWSRASPLTTTRRSSQQPFPSDYPNMTKVLHTFSRD